ETTAEKTAEQAAEKTAEKAVASRPVAEKSGKKKSSDDKAKKPRQACGVRKLPKNEYKALRRLKKACKKAGVKAKKGELLRAGLSLLAKQKPSQIQALLLALEAGGDEGGTPVK